MDHLLYWSVSMTWHFSHLLFFQGWGNSSNARLWTSPPLRSQGAAAQADVNWDVLPPLSCVCYYNSQFPSKRSGCGAEEEEEDVCLAADAAWLRTEAAVRGFLERSWPDLLSAASSATFVNIRVVGVYWNYLLSTWYTFPKLTLLLISILE